MHAKQPNSPINKAPETCVGKPDEMLRLACSCSANMPSWLELSSIQRAT